MQKLLINIGGVLLFGGRFTLDSRGAEQRVQQRKAISKAQILHTHPHHITDVGGPPLNPLLPLPPRPPPQGSAEGLPGVEGSGLQNLLINIGGVLLFGGLFTVDSRGAEQRVQQRKAIRDAQIRAGDREVFVNEEGETMSKLKEVGVLPMTSSVV